jgi:hypothetical protein
MNGSRWYPVRTSSKARPEPGQLIAHQHAVWRVTTVEDTPLTDTDRDVWLDWGMPDLATWHGRPYRMDVEWVAGAEPAWFTDGHRSTSGRINVLGGSFPSWHVYEGGRWPQCSCCGEPMPCRAELQDRQVTASLNEVTRLEAIPPGACWACSEPITTRQGSVTYPGDNLDLPGGQQPRFHTRGKCRPTAERYEERWLTTDPRRERILTWPRCEGILVVHADGSTECVSGRTPVGTDCVSQPDCRGHLTHDHSTRRACYVQDNWLDPAEWGDACCPRGCRREGHVGAHPAPRPKRRAPSTEGLFR